LRDVDGPRLWALTDDAAHFISEKKAQSGYDEILHIGCYAFVHSYANTAISEGMDALSSGRPLSLKHATTIALINAGHRTHEATEEAARTRLGFLRLVKGGRSSSDLDRVFAELNHERFYMPRPTAVSGKLDALRQAFADQTLEVTRHAASKAAA
jgi:hypothetical protein